MNIIVYIIYIISVFFAQAISFTLAGASPSKITSSAKMLAASLLSAILSVALITIETIIFKML